MQDFPGLGKTSRKLSWAIWQSRRLLKFIEKYFKACQTLQDLSNFSKVILDLLAIQETFINDTKIFGSLQDNAGLGKLQESYLGPSGNPGDF